MSALATNPFFVLELPVTAGPREVEREAARLLGMLELGLEAARTYPTPLGRQERRAEDVRAAAATLRDPRKRLLAELWAASEPVASPLAGSPAPAGSPSPAASGTGSSSGTASDAGPATTPASSPAGWTDAFAATGWGRP